MSVITKTPSPDKDQNIQRLLNIELTVTAILSEKTLTIGDILNWRIGSVIEFAKSINAPIDVVVNEKKVAEGSAAKVGETFAIQLSKVQDIQQTVQAMKE